MPADETILILGGTAQAIEIAERLVSGGGKRVITSLAGRTADPKRPPGELHIGGFGGVEGLGAYLLTEGITRVIDATHPFARQISANAAAACQKVGVELEVVKRALWQEQPGDRWQPVADVTEAAAVLPAGARAFLALGRQHLAPFTARSDCHFVIRMVDPPEGTLGFASFDLVLGKPSQDTAAEAALLKAHEITHLVCRNSGGEAGYGKIAAARTLGLPVALIGRPDQA